MKRFLGCLAAAALCAGALSGCGADDAEPTAPGDDTVVGKQWQVVNLYTTPDAPSAIAKDTTQVPHLSFGEHTMVGSTGCVPFTADVSFRHDEKDSTIWDADSMHVEEVTYEDAAAGPECTGSPQRVDFLLRNLIATSNDFSYEVNENNQLILTLRTDAVDSPIIRLATL